MKLTNREVLEAKSSLGNLMAVKMPITNSTEFASLDYELDVALLRFTKTRDSLMRDYQINIKAAEKEGEVNLSSPEGEAAIREFLGKMNELRAEEVTFPDIKIHLPSDCPELPPNMLRPIIPFIATDK